MRGQIFISYRREESRWSARSLRDRLCRDFDQKQIFMDIDAIALGEDFVEAIETTVAKCDVLVAVIGNNWLTTKDELGNRRLENPEDFVRMEIGAALKRKIRVIPVLVDGALMPRATDLPEDLKPLVRRNALMITDTSFEGDCQRLAAAIRQVLEKVAAEEEERLDAERRQREEKQRQESERLASEQREKDRLKAAERLEKERLQAEQREKERLQAEQREKERLQAEQRRKEWLEAEQREKDKSEAEQVKRQGTHPANSTLPGPAPSQDPGPARSKPPTPAQGEQHTCRTPSRESVSQGLERVREAAKQRKKERFTALLHHLTIDLPRAACSWLQVNLADLRSRIHRGTYRAPETPPIVQSKRSTKRKPSVRVTLLAALLLLIMIMVLIGGAVLWGAYSAYQGIYQMTSPRPQTFEPIPATARQNAAQLKWATFVKALAQGTGAEFRFSADDLNAWFFSEGKNADLIPHVRFRAMDGWIVAEVSVSLDFMPEFPALQSFRNRFFNGQIGARLAVEKG